MAFYLIIRGPLGIGKSTVSQRLARKVRGEPISIDRILEDEGLWDSGRLSEFLQANAFAADRASKLLVRGTPVIFDGNFYWKAQIRDLLRRLDYRHYVFTLKAPESVCARRDHRRAHPYGRTAVREVFAKSTRFDYGIGVDATGSIPSVVREILSHLLLDRAP